ncbi:hypothetical protein [Leptonema illini]|uniref:Uncharacterized protein n=1 Tax=Leptonema illini DSM 21528 TaxID=929563 RepID=H2CH64_9LEPT|nr:hypothetical protein [Leptonema illini]EHQ06934.1 hypothetical protein Lepil_2258 [Leptonema illini DSM 21528]
MQWVPEFPSTVDRSCELPVLSSLPDEIARPSFLLRDEAGTLSLLCGKMQLPAAIISADEFGHSAVWRLILSLYKTSIVDAARWWRLHHNERPPVGIMQAFGLAEHHRSLADWKEMSELEASAAELNRRYDLPLNTLRLWNRLGDDEQKGWLHIFELRQVKKNLIREIVMDYYDLDAEGRRLCLEECTVFAENWQARSSVFPSQELRDLVHRRRYPQYAAMRQDLFALKKELNTPKNIAVELPADLESGYVQLRIELRRPDDVKALSAFLSDAKRQALLEQIIERI